jgi:uncharacterized protein
VAVELLVFGLVLVVMVVGLVGVVVPVMPGLLIVWLAGVVTLLWQGADAAGWVVAGVLTVLFGLGTAATIYLPARTGRRGGLSAGTLGAVIAGALVGFVVVPVVGLLLGAAVGLYLGERLRLGSHRPAWASTGSVLRAYGAGVLVQLAIGVTMIGVWIVAVLVRL